MASVIQTENNQKLETENTTLNVLFGKLDAAIDDVQNGRVISSEELWKKIDAI